MDNVHQPHPVGPEKLARADAVRARVISQRWRSKRNLIGFVAGIAARIGAGIEAGLSYWVCLAADQRQFQRVASIINAMEAYALGRERTVQQALQQTEDLHIDPGNGLVEILDAFCQLTGWLFAALHASVQKHELVEQLAVSAALDAGLSEVELRELARPWLRRELEPDADLVRAFEAALEVGPRSVAYGLFEAA